MPPEEPNQVYHPDMIDPAGNNGLQCFLSSDRPCGPDCMAYCSPPLAKGAEYDGKQWANCMLLTNAHQASKHLVAIANLLKNAASRAATPGVPKVM